MEYCYDNIIKGYYSKLNLRLLSWYKIMLLDKGIVIVKKKKII